MRITALVTASVNTQLAESGENSAQLAMLDQRLATYQGNVERLVLSHEIQHTLDQRVTAQVAEFAKGDSLPGAFHRRRSIQGSWAGTRA
jgi:hypothetical protein